MIVLLVGENVGQTGRFGIAATILYVQLTVVLHPLLLFSSFLFTSIPHPLLFLLVASPTVSVHLYFVFSSDLTIFTLQTHSHSNHARLLAICPLLLAE